ncbi:MAG TPA: adenylate/guanylate cyclase domain-containing protein [Haliangium sp.]|nr:adenylate/guanylate cyclase domain-containing protein [Haliangium sp.]
MSEPVPSGSAIDVTPVVAWLVERAIEQLELTALLEGAYTRLVAAGLPLVRVNVGLRLLHPLIRAHSLTWRHGHAGIANELFPHGHDPAEWLRSPYALLSATRRMVRVSTADTDAVERLPLIARLAREGATEYIAFGAAFDLAQERGVLLSFATDHPGGFTDAHIAGLQRLAPQLAVVCRLYLEQQVLQYVTSTYLGRDAGSRVLNGQIRRGEGELIHAAVLYSDLRNSTRLAETHPPAELLGLLDEYFECTAGSVLAEGGEVLALIGDAVLAIFPVAPGNERAACEAAVAAARRAMARHAEVTATRAASGKTVFDLGIGLHLGDVVYGNIGVPERLCFTVIGPTANEVARLESLTKTLGHRVLASDSFAREVELAWQHLGLHELRGARTPRAVFALPGLGTPRARTE